ncbi:phosphatidylglycerophosphatase A [Paracoccus sp. WLY502]|uniref:phosphatidylglycerophosphatase A family protein n=1 Tax=Paracoccus yibinensis TaxID=3068891 RepID=UPI00279663DB|nr:phosphatidylglycerophosphatase A [Paracoccus sp. WLY502]MDQ1899990.1 phosphatidylglycerophosphatase A [Paracoccus sp. WLY502]
MIAMITTVFGIGRLRPGPGTWGSAFAVLLAVLIYQAGGALLIPLGAVLAALIGFWAVPQALRMTTDEDPSEIVIDEVAGQWLAMSFTVIPLWRHGISILDAWPGFVVPFLLFRLFDIWKPWLVGRADRQGGAVGVMMDDLWAGLFAGIGSVALAGLYHAVLEPML